MQNLIRKNLLAAAFYIFVIFANNIISNKIYTTAALLVAGILFMFGYMGYNVSFNIMFLGATTIIWSLGEIFCSINHMPLLIENALDNDIGVYSSYANTANRLGTVVSSLIGAGLISLYVTRIFGI